MTAVLKTDKLCAKVADKKVIFDVDVKVEPGEVVVLMGPNGAGKSSLAQVIAGHPDYEVTKGKIELTGRDVTKLKPWEKARAGIFMAWQYPPTITGITIYELLHTACDSKLGDRFSLDEFEGSLKQALKSLKISAKFLDRNVNEGFSGGEKKKVEMLQLRLLKPKVAVLDETDSGLDIDALKTVAKNVKNMAGHKMGILVITHYQRLLNYLKPDRVLVMIKGRIVKSGGQELVGQLEKKGYSWLKE